jgi:hypothetical protein
MKTKPTFTIPHGLAADMIQAYPGNQFFTVTFVKRETGETRVMNCRKGVRSKGSGGLKFDPAKKRLVSVFDMQKGGFRFISLDEIRRVALQGKVFNVVPGDKVEEVKG